MSAIKDLKNQLTLANKKFKNARYEEAIEAYGDIIVDERLSAKEGKEASGDVSSSGKVFNDEFEILFDAYLNRSACRSTIGEWEFAAMDALKCKEMNNISIKAYARLATAYQGSGDHLACIKTCEEGLDCVILILLCVRFGRIVTECSTQRTILRRSSVLWATTTATTMTTIIAMHTAMSTSNLHF